jgi:hypothetical protein
MEDKQRDEAVLGFGSEIHDGKRQIKFAAKISR